MKSGSRRLISKLIVGIVGSGAVGHALAQRLHQKFFDVGAIVSRNAGAARRLAKKTNCQRSGDDLSILRNCNFIIIAVPGSEISRVAKKISDGSLFGKNAILIHTSGALDAKILTAEQRRGRPAFSVAAMHPMQTFPAGIKWNDESLEAYFGNMYFGVDGSRQAVAVTRRVARTIGAGSFIIPENMKGLYHAGGVFASNFMVALMYMAQEIYQHAGLSDRQSRDLLYPIMMQTLNNIFQYGSVASLTGPAARNEQTVINKHIKDLEAFGADFQKVYRGLTEVCYKIARKKQLKQYPI